MIGKKKELIERYVSVDPKIGGSEIMRRIEKDHGLTVGKSTVSKVRATYFASVGKTVEALARRPSLPAPAAPPSPVAIIQSFVAAVRAVGGKEAALELLNILAL